MPRAVVERLLDSRGEPRGVRASVLGPLGPRGNILGLWGLLFGVVADAVMFSINDLKVTVEPVFTVSRPCAALE